MGKNKNKKDRRAVEDCGGDSQKAEVQQEGVTPEDHQQSERPFDLPLVTITDEFNTIWRARNDYPFIGILVASRKLLNAGTFTSDGKVTDKEGKLRDKLTLSTKEQWEAVKASVDANRAARPVPYEEFLDEVEELIYTLGEVQKRNPWGVDFTMVRTQVMDVQEKLSKAKEKVEAGEAVDCKAGVADAREAKSAILALEISKLENQLVRVGKATNQEEAVATALEQIGKIGDVSKRRSHLLGAINQLKTLSQEQAQKSQENVALGDLPPAPAPQQKQGYSPSTHRGEGTGTHGKKFSRHDYV